eukprot:TRINITY_DN6060_c0_g2_i1.p1 TRINITY_DN6060_c0_g2~~TRINITY_DN6060_c0_g2_i1.p1  ORF type:complete len:653 (-),score=79.98 TRINITY_DN6060_c0_g2_i1:203-2161(-)
MSHRGRGGHWRPKAPDQKPNREHDDSSLQTQVSTKRRKLNDVNSEITSSSAPSSAQQGSVSSQNATQRIGSAQGAAKPPFRGSDDKNRGHSRLNRQKRGRGSRNRRWHRDRVPKSSSSSSSSSSTSSDTSSSSSEDEDEAPVPPAPVQRVPEPAPQTPLVPKKKLSEVKQVHGYYYDEMIDRYFRKPLPGAPGWTAYQNVMKRQKDALESEKQALEVERRRLEKLATKESNPDASSHSGGFLLASDILYDTLDEGAHRQPFLASIQLSEIDSSRFAARAKARTLTRRLMQQQPTFEKSPIYLGPGSICTDMILFDPAPLRLPVDDTTEDDRLVSAVAVGTKAGQLCLLWPRSKSFGEIDFDCRRCIKFGDEGGISSVRSAPNRANSPFVSLTTWGGNGAPGTLWLHDIRAGFVRTPYKLRRGSAWCHEWQPQRSDVVSIGTETCALLVNIETNVTTKIFTAKGDVFYQQFDRAGRTLLNGTRDGKIKTYDTRQPPGSIPSSGSHADIMQHKQSISCMYLMNDENKLISSSSDGTICVWERRMCRSLRTMKFPNKHSLFRFAVDPSEKYVSVACADRMLRVWDLSFHAASEEDMNPSVEWELPVSAPVGENWSSGVACCSDWIAKEGRRVYDPRVIFMDGVSLATAPLLPTSR